MELIYVTNTNKEDKEYVRDYVVNSDGYKVILSVGDDALVAISKNPIDIATYDA